MISIIIPTLNEESVIEGTLRSLKSKLTIPHEIIVSDGQSKDRTIEIAKNIADKVVEYTGTTRQTIAQGRNDGARMAGGEFLVFLDADSTIPDPDKFFSYAIKLFDNPKLMAVVPWLKVLPEMATTTDKIMCAFYNSYLSILNNIFGLGVSGGELQMMRKKDFDSIGGYNEKLVAAEDVDILTRLTKTGRVRLDPKLIVFHTGRRIHKVGWPRLMWKWSTNALSYMFRGKSHDTEWTPIR